VQKAQRADEGPIAGQRRSIFEQQAKAKELGATAPARAIKPELKKPVNLGSAVDS